jgi:hypothetical protein
VRAFIACLALASAASLGLASAALASSQFAAELDQLCSAQGRAPSNPAELARLASPPSGDCALCHAFDASLGEVPSDADVTAEGDAFLAGEIDVFCAPGNQPPVIEPIADVTAGIGQLILFPVHASDPEGDRVVLTVSGLPTGARFTVDGNSNGSFFWIPATGQRGTYIVTFTGADRGTPIRTTSVEVTFTIDGGNRPPVLDPIGPFDAVAGMPLEIPLSATDADGDALTFFVDPALEGASLVPGDPGTASFLWTPEASDVGNHSLTFSVSDGLWLDEETIVVTVGAVNAPPTLEPIGDRVVELGVTLEITLVATDIDQDLLTFSTEGLPEGAVLADFGDGTGLIEWTPDEVGVHIVTVTVTDDGTPQELASETFTIEAEAQPAALVLLSATWMRYESLVVSGEGAAPHAPVDVFDALSGALLGSTVADATGAFELVVEPAVVPCAVLASSDKNVSDPLDVEGAGMGCSSVPRARVHDVRWLCGIRWFYLLGDRAPAGARVRVYDAELGTLIGEVSADTHGRFFLGKRLDAVPERVEVGVEWGGIESMLDILTVKQPDRCGVVFRGGCDHDRDKDRGKSKGHDHDRDKDRGKSKGHDHDRDKDRGKSKGHDHDRDKDRGKSKGHDHDRDEDRGKSKSKSHDRDWKGSRGR